MAVISFNVELFRKRFSEFSDERIFDDEVLTTSWDMAACYISTDDYGCLHGACREQAVQLMTAHIQKLMLNAASGQSTTMVTSATIDKVSVSTTPPPVKSQLEWWLNTTPYGAQLWALLSMKSVGGMYLGGSPTLAGFRGPAGGFYGRR